MKFKSEDGEEALVAENADKVFHTVEAVSMAVLTSLQHSGITAPPQHLYVILTAAAAAIQIAAKIMSMPEKDAKDMEEWAEAPADRTAVLTAALLMTRCLLPNKEGFTFEFNPLNILAAIDAMKKITGNGDTSMLTKGMVEAAFAYTSPDHFFDNTRNNDPVDLSKFRTLN